MTILRKKLEANQRRLKRPDRLKVLDSFGVSASALGIEAHENVVSALRGIATGARPQPMSASDVAEKLRAFGTGDFLILLDWNFEDEPAFIVPRNAVADALAENPEFFGLDGFIAVDGGSSRAIFVDIDEHSELAFEEAGLPAPQDKHAQD